MSKQNHWIDVSVPLHTGMVHWPGDPEPSFERIAEMEQGANANVTFCRMSAHTGTHMDAPCHFLDRKTGIDQFPLEIGIGPARVISMRPDGQVITGEELRNKRIQPGERVLFKTRNSLQRWENRDFQTDYVGLDSSAGEFLAEVGIALVGVDYLSVGVFEGDGAQTHRLLLKAGIWILEGLNLFDIEEGYYEFICLPLPIAGSDGSPARVALRQL
jgi:arylformamidase